LDIFGRIRAGGARTRVQRRDNAAIYLYALPGGRMITDRPLNNKHYKLVSTSTHVRKVLHLKSLRKREPASMPKTAALWDNTRRQRPTRPGRHSNKRSSRHE
jgi:hypothetical protein